jgi:hypothetical protein
MRRAGPTAPVFFSVVAATLSLISCGGGGGSDSDGPGSPGEPENHAPVATDDRARADDAALAAIDVLTNDTDADGDELTVAIEEQPPLGKAAVNADNTVALTDLPSGFKGVTHFTYRVSDPDGQSAVGHAAVFVGTEPFSFVFAGDESGDGSNELYLADMAAPAQKLSAATDGTLRLEGFVASEDGSTVVYRRADTGNANVTDLSFVRTSAPDEQVRIAFPGGAVPVQSADGEDQYAVSADGKWIAAVAGDAQSDALYVLNVDDPDNVARASPTGAVHASQPRFSENSAALYFLATAEADGGNRDLYTVVPDTPGSPAQISAPVAASTADIVAYSVASDQSRILLQAIRGGKTGLYFVDPSHLQTEVRVSHPLLVGESIVETTVGLPPGLGGSVRGDQVAYTTQSVLGFFTYVASVSANPNPHVIAPTGAHVVGFRPDDAALLYTRGGLVQEVMLDGSANASVGAGSFGYYDSTGNIVVLLQYLASGGSPATYQALAVTTRASFGTTQQLGTPVLAAPYVDITGMSHAVAVLGEGATTGPAPDSARLALVNALAPDTLIHLADFESPLGLETPSSQVVER